MVYQVKFFRNIDFGFTSPHQKEGEHPVQPIHQWEIVEEGGFILPKEGDFVFISPQLRERIVRRRLFMCQNLVHIFID